MKRIARPVAPPRPGSFRSRLTAAAVAAGVSASALILALVPPTATAATWTDTEHAAGTFQASVLSAPVIESCTEHTVLVLGAHVTLTWRYPPSTGHTLSAQYLSGPSPDKMTPITNPDSVSTTGPNHDGVYTSTFQGDLFAGLLGGSAHIGLTTMLPGSSWTSKMSTAHATFPLLGTRTCPFTNAP
jgi:hypothetical protein